MSDIPAINSRRPLDDDNPEGYLESDKDFLLNNFDAAVWLLENAGGLISNQDRVLSKRLSSSRRRYKRQVQDMIFMLQAEMEGIDVAATFEPSSAVESAAYHLIQESNRFRALLEVSES